MMARGGVLRCWVVASALAVLGSITTPAGAVYQCGPDKDDCQCGAPDPYPCCSNGGNCTWWAWEQACCNWAVALPSWGNANQWAGNASVDPNYDVLSSPVVPSLSNRLVGTWGHVAWVISTSGSNVTVTEQNCDYLGAGHRTYTYAASYFDGGYIVKKGATCECQAGDTQTQSCGNCGTGTQARSCNSCTWGSWGACSGDGACAPNATDQQACGSCGNQTRSCQNDCSWSAFGACDDPCATGSGAATGSGGATGSGAATNSGGANAGGSTSAGGSWNTGSTSGAGGHTSAGGHAGTASSGAANPPTEPSDMNGTVGCSLSPRRDRSSGVVLLALLAWLGIAIGRRRRRVVDRPAST